MGYLRTPRVQIAIALTVLYAAALVVIINTQVVSVLAGIFVLGLPLAAGAALWLAHRSGAGPLRITDMSPRTFFVGLTTAVLVGGTLAVVAGRVIEPADLIGRASLNGLIFGTAVGIGDVVGRLLEQRDRRRAGQRSS